jgi:hypothetical protein
MPSLRSGHCRRWRFLLTHCARRHGKGTMQKRIADPTRVGEGFLWVSTSCPLPNPLPVGEGNKPSMTVGLLPRFGNQQSPIRNQQSGYCPGSAISNPQSAISSRATAPFCNQRSAIRNPQSVIPSKKDRQNSTNVLETYRCERLSQRSEVICGGTAFAKRPTTDKSDKTATN